ncbi:MAG TPA: GerAB/ArcD/ProY family transporter [Clostridia bacterium]|nr:GerAB/ArcD/ProY family transporter [Clostridia bacterium]
MKSNTGSEITSKQLIFVMIGTMLGSGILSLPRLAAKEAGQDGWMAVILGALFPLASLSLIRLLYKKNNEASFVKVCRQVSGKWMGGLFSIIFAVYSILTSGILLRVFIEVVSLFLLTETPLLVKLIMMLSVSAYLAASNAKVLGRVNEFLFYLLLPIIFFALPAITENADIHNLMPVFNHKLSDYARASLATGLAYSGFELYIVFHPYVSREKDAFGASLYAVLITLVIYLYFVISTVMVFGTELVQVFAWPSLRVLGTLEVPIFERIEFFFIQWWIAVSFRPITIQYFCASHIITELFKMKSQTWSTLAMFPFIILIAYYPKDIFQVFKYSDYIGRAALIIGIALPLILIIFGFFAGMKGAAKDENT